ncbi:MAG: AAA family ATPase [Candidatus Lambdaproteobacteria bacterium]|nr:AAA family ATPase [Candidatus Lambdaproteobacteria bacterium]
MVVVSFLHQKGGTGKSTLALALALGLVGRGARVLLLDADYQGTCIEWGNRHGMRMGLEVHSQVQPIIDAEARRFERSIDWLVVDGPPALSPMTESIIKASGRLLIPVRPAPPDLWALPWFAAVLGKQLRAGHPVVARVVINQYRDEPLAPLQREIARSALAVHPRPIPADPAFPRLFQGEPLPAGLQQAVLGLLLE